MTGKAVYLLEIDNLRWMALRTKRFPKSFRFEKIPAVCVGDKQVFLCGGQPWKGKSHVARLQALLCDAWEMVELRHMIRSRVNHAIIYDPNTATIYVFGGHLTSDRPLNNTEGYSFLTGKWTDLPLMLHIDGSVRACKHQNAVYLKGYSTQIEVFSLVTQTYSMLGLHIPTGQYLGYLLINDGDLCLFEDHNYMKWRFEAAGATLVREYRSKDIYYTSGELEPVVKDHFAYLLYQKSTYECVDLNTGIVASRGNLAFFAWQKAIKT